MLRLPLLLLTVCGLQLTVAVHTHSEYFSAPAGAGHDGECQDNKAGKSAKLGETWTTTGCKRATCVMREDYTGKMMLSIAEDGCPILQEKAGCHRTSVSRTKKYPDCCPKQRCISATTGKVEIISGEIPAPSNPSPSSPSSPSSSSSSRPSSPSSSSSSRPFRPSSSSSSRPSRPSSSSSSQPFRPSSSSSSRLSRPSSSSSSRPSRPSSSRLSRPSSSSSSRPSRPSSSSSSRLSRPSSFSSRPSRPSRPSFSGSNRKKAGQAGNTSRRKYPKYQPRN